MHTNRLSRESSPYLLQHQHNPVDWYAWGDEAFAAARAQNKPIFLSVGYSTCYWCHVMERESFENPQVADVMNRHCINIKVDREERPDVDQLYMTAVQVLTRRGGWPMSVFLTPDLKPFYGGTYFPPSDRGGMPGFVTLLNGIEDAWQNRPDEVLKAADQLESILSQVSEPPRPDESFTIDLKWIETLLERSVSDFDPRHGGFGGAPKFPRQTLLELLLVANERVPSADRFRKLRHTLDALAQGGIRDQLGGAFHRYSTDSKWLVPHFEIMLYDNALLAWCYVEAYRQTGNVRYADVARGILDFVLSDLTSPEGAFYTAIDAETDAREGLTYLWTADEIGQVLGADDAGIFNRAYGVDRGPNFADPHHGNGTPDTNVLYQPVPVDTLDIDLAALDAMRRKLLAHRRTRKQPMTDTKIITSWCALMIRAFATAGRHLNEDRYTQAANRAADFLLTQHRAPDGSLHRTSRNGTPRHAGFLEDYAFLVQALGELSGPRHQQAADALTQLMRDKFEDAGRGGFYFTVDGAPDMIVRQKTATDSPLPSGNAVAAMTLLQQNASESVRAMIETFGEQLRTNGEGMSALLQTALLYVKAHGPITVSPSVSTRTPSIEARSKDAVTMRARWTDASAIQLEVTIADGFHINAAHAAPGLIATTLTTAPEADQLIPPAPTLRQYAYSEQDIPVYEGKVIFHVRFNPPLAPTHPVRLTLRYQPCDDQSCLAPVSKAIEIARA